MMSTNNHFTDEELIENYRSSKDKTYIDCLVRRYTGLIENTSYELVKKVPDTYLVEDFIGYGYIGFMDAVEKFDPTKAKYFGSYAKIRVQGEILDYLRGDDPISRSRRKKIKTYQSAKEKLIYSSLEVNDDNLKKILGIDDEELMKLRMDIKKSNGMINMLDYSDIEFKISSDRKNLGYSPTCVQEKSYLKKEQLEILRKAISTLNNSEETVIFEHYFSDREYKDIGHQLGLTESRISQIQKSAHAKLAKKKAMQEMYFS